MTVSVNCFANTIKPRIYATTRRVRMTIDGVPVLDEFSSSFYVNSKSSVAVECDFLDENGVPVVPDSVDWTLIDELGNIVNAEQRITIAVPKQATSVVFAILPADTDFVDGSQRTVIINSSYSSSLGVSISTVTRFTFNVVDVPFFAIP